MCLLFVSLIMVISHLLLYICLPTNLASFMFFIPPGTHTAALR